MSDPMSTQNVLAVFERTESEIASLLGERTWSRIQNNVSDVLERLRASLNETEREDLTDQLLDFFLPYRNVREYLLTQLEIQPEIENVKIVIEQFAKDIDSQEAQSFAEEAARIQWTYLDHSSTQFRRAFIKPGGLGGAKSIKFSNLQLDIGEMSEIAAGSLLAGTNILDNPHPLVIAAGILVTVRAITKAMTLEIGEQEASVFWGILQGCDSNSKTINKTDLIHHTNAQRKKYGLKTLDDLEISNSIKRLENLGSIKKLSLSEWQVVESYKIQ